MNQIALQYKVLSMDNEKVFSLSFVKVYPMLIAKAERKSRIRDDVLKFIDHTIIQ